MKKILFILFLLKLTCAINLNIIIESLRLSMLIYNYDNTKQYSSIQEYLNQNIKTDKLLNDIASYAPNGKVIKYINNNKTDLQVAVTKSYNKQKLSVVFRGSESKKDWLYNLKFPKTIIKNNNNIKVHKGFYLQLKNNINQLDQLVLNNIKPNTQIIITGHSLGGALATIYGYLLCEKTDNVITIISFASPRVGNLKFKQSFNNKSNLIHHRITNNKDLICAIPIFNYHHVGKLINLKTKNNIFLNLKDHDINEYYNNLMKNRDRVN